ncbi:hypothetical protein D3C75_1094680 [compost metagenome]
MTRLHDEWLCHFQHWLFRPISAKRFSILGLRIWRGLLSRSRFWTRKLIQLEQQLRILFVLESIALVTNDRNELLPFQLLLSLRKGG